jgi:hypothetical protein
MPRVRLLIFLPALAGGSQRNSIPIICQGVSVRRPYIVKTDENKISEYVLYITKTVYYKLSCGLVTGWVLKAKVNHGLDHSRSV